MRQVMRWDDEARLHVHLDLPPHVLPAMEAYARRLGRPLDEVFTRLVADDLADRLSGRNDPVEQLMAEAEVTARVTLPATVNLPDRAAGGRRVRQRRRTKRLKAQTRKRRT